MMVNGIIMQLMVLEYILITIMRSMKASGAQTYRMVRAPKSGQMGQYSWDNIKMEKRMVSANIIGQMEEGMKESG